MTKPLLDDLASAQAFVEMIYQSFEDKYKAVGVAPEFTDSYRKTIALFEELRSQEIKKIVQSMGGAT